MMRLGTKLAAYCAIMLLALPGARAQDADAPAPQTAETARLPLLKPQQVRVCAYKPPLSLRRGHIWET